MRSDRPRTSASNLLACAACCLLMLGCASLRSPDTALPGSTKPKGPLTKSEAQAAVERIDNVRDQAQCTQAIALWQEGKPDASRRLLEQILARNSRQPLARRLLADLAVERGDADEAERLLVELVHQHPADESARASLAWLYESQGREPEAQALFQQLEEGFSPSA